MAKAKSLSLLEFKASSQMSRNVVNTCFSYVGAKDSRAQAANVQSTITSSEGNCTNVVCVVTRLL